MDREPLGKGQWKATGATERRMSRREQGARARYEEIAIDIAQKISAGTIKVGTRILGRSSLAGTYNVSPETIRRAVAILHDRGIVQAVAGSGIRVHSKELAAEFLESLQARSALEELQGELSQLFEQRRRLDARIEAAMTRLSAYAGRALGSVRGLEEVIVPPGAASIDKTLADLAVRRQTGATVVALVRGEQEFFSPDPALALQPGDLLTVAGPDAARTRARALLTAIE